MIEVKKIMAMLTLISWITTGIGQRLYNPTGSPYTEAVAANPDFIDAFACAANPALLPNLKGLAAATSLEKKYLIEGLNLAQLSLVFGKPSGGGGIYLKYFGNVAYSETHAAINYGKRLGDLSVGASFYYHSYFIAGFYRINIVSIGLHSLWKLSDKVYTSLQLVNPPFTRSGSRIPAQPAEYRLGLAYRTSEAVCLSTEFRKTGSAPIQVNTAMQVHFNKKFFAKAGLYTGGPQPFLGLGWTVNRFQVQVSVYYHPALGSTPGIIFLYNKTADDLP